MALPSAQEEAITALFRDRPLAHAILFAHRHQNATPAFAIESIRDFHSALKAYCEIAFRGSAKSTRAEEAVVLMTCFREIQHGLIVGANLDKACERLHSIRRQFEQNDYLLELFGDLRGQPWGDEKIETRTGITLQAMGRGQAIRGTKAEDTRPDFILADDVEDEESVRTPEGREKVQTWFFKELLPSGDGPRLRVRVLANDMHPECIANKLKRPGSGFKVAVYPWEHLNEKGEREATWPDRFPLPVIDETRRRLYSLGRAADYESEYMCHSESPAAKPFKREMIRNAGQGDVPAQVRTWQAVYMAFDPARTTHATSADTGFAAWSWIGNRLVVWDAWGKQLLPDQIISSIFASDQDYRPVAIGIDAVGLAEFMLQPIRTEQAKLGLTLPIKSLPAPKSKTERIRALQPYFNAREVWFAKPLPELEEQLLGFPTGKRDILDALAYSLVMRAPAPIYEDFQTTNISEISFHPRERAWLCLNATRSLLTGVLVQLVDGALRVFADWVREGDPADLVRSVISAAALEAGRECRLVVTPQHQDRYTNVGLVQAIRKIPMECRTGYGPDQGRAEVRQLLRKQTRGFPALMVSPEARWTVNAFAGGYARALLKGGVLADHAEEGAYRVLMEGLEAFAGLLRSGITDETDDNAVNYEYAPDGRRYISARVRRA